jgi:ornithine--oxo-acid transaminase
VADEIQTGIARTGRLLACHHEDVRPDVLILGKALSGGVLPISAILADDPIILCLKPGDHGSTFGGNPLACAVAQTALSIVAEEKLADNAAEMGEIFREGVRALQSPLIQEVRGKGLLNAVVLSENAGVKAGDLCLRLKEQGLLAKNTRDHIIRFAPPLVIQRAQIEAALAILKFVF